MKTLFSFFCVVALWLGCAISLSGQTASLVQSNYVEGSSFNFGGSVITSLPNPCQAGDTLIVTLGELEVDSTPANLITDSLGNKFQLITNIFGGDYAPGISIFIATNIIGGADTITNTFGNCGNNLYVFNPQVETIELSGINNNYIIGTGGGGLNPIFLEATNTAIFFSFAKSQDGGLSNPVLNGGAYANVPMSIVSSDGLYYESYGGLWLNGTNGYVAGLYQSSLTTGVYSGCWCLIGFYTASGHSQTYPVVELSSYGGIGDLTSLTNVQVTSGSIVVNCPGAHFLPADSNKWIEVYAAGAWHESNGPSVWNSDLIAQITNIASSTQVLISNPSYNTETNTGKYGSDNDNAFSEAQSACSFPQGTIDVTNGNYLVLSPRFKYQSFNDINIGIPVNRGGLTYLGTGTNVTIGNFGGWEALNNNGYFSLCQGSVFGIPSTTINNSYPLIFTNLLLDSRAWGFSGSLSNGYNTGYQNSWGDSHFMQIYAPVVPDSVEFLNCTVQNFMGEGFIDTVGITNTVLTVSHCILNNDNATDLNPQEVVLYANNDLFENSYAAMEFYEGGQPSPSWVIDCLVSNSGPVVVDYYFSTIYSNVPPFIIESNIFSAPPPNSADPNPVAIETFNSDNIYILNNLFTNYSAVSIDIGCDGYSYFGVQPVTYNFVVGWNTFTSGDNPIDIDGGDGTEKDNVMIFSNNFTSAGSYVVAGNGFGTNMVAFDNIGGSCPIENQMTGQWILDETNNSYASVEIPMSYPPATNLISYANGWSFTAYGGSAAWTNLPPPNINAISLDDTHPNQIPTGAVMVVTNDSSDILKVSPGASLTAITNLPVGSDVVFYWTGMSWTNQPNF